MKQQWMIAMLPLMLAYTSLVQAECGVADLDPIALDKNKNGAISRNEAEGSTLAWVYDQVDTNGDGIISQREFANRCNSQAQGAQSSEPVADREPTAAEKAAAEKAERQKSRQASKVDRRVDQETDKAVDSAIDKGLDRLFGK